MEKQLWSSRYKIVKLIGQGAFAEVFLAEDWAPNGLKRVLPDQAIHNLNVLGEFSPDYEFMERDIED